MDLTVERIIGWGATRGVAHGEKADTSECNGMVKARNLVALTAVPRMVMHARGIQPLARIVGNVESSLPRLIQRVCVRHRLLHPRSHHHLHPRSHHHLHPRSHHLLHHHHHRLPQLALTRKILPIVTMWWSSNGV